MSDHLPPDPDDSESAEYTNIYHDFVKGKIDYYDAVIRLTWWYDDVEKAQKIVNGWEDELAT